MTFNDNPATANVCSKFDPLFAETSKTENIIFYTLYFAVLFIISAVNIVGNSFIIHTIRKKPSLRVPEYYFIFSLACSDLLLGCVYPIYNVSHTDFAAIHNSLGEWPVCTVLITLVLGLLYISSWNLVGITCTRYLAIRDPLRFQTIFSHKVAIRAVILTWMILIVLACCLYIRPYPPDDYHCYKSCRYELVLGEADVIFTTIAYVICPFTVMAILWGHMTCIARKQVRAIVDQQVSGGSSGLQGRTLVFKKEIRMYSMAGILLGLYTIAWVPFIIFEFLTIGDPEMQARTQWWRALVRLLLHSNTAVNVIVYAGRIKDFRDAIRRDLKMCKTNCAGPCNKNNKIHDPHQHIIMTPRPKPDGSDSICIARNYNESDM